jgi:hypothetical protein
MTWFIVGAVIGGIVGAGAALTAMALAYASKRADLQADLQRLSDYYDKILKVQKGERQVRKPVIG